MFAIIVGSTVILLTLLFLAGYIYTYKQRGDLTRTEEAELLELVLDGAFILGGLGVVQNLNDDFDIIQPQSRKAINAWLARYKQFQEAGNA